MKELAPILGAGGAFTGAAVAGLLIGILISSRTGNAVWGFVGLFVGIALGGYSAYRLLRRSVG